MRTLLIAAALLAPPTTTPVPTPKPAAAAPAAVPGFEVVIQEALIGALLSAVMPYDSVMESEVGALGFTKTVEVTVTLTNPRVKVTAGGVKVTLDYKLASDTALLDGRSGTATPTMTLTPVPSKQIIEGKLTRSGITLPGGIELPIEDMVEPIEIPAVIPQEIEAGEKIVAAEARMNEVILEEGRIRVRGDATFKARAPK